MRRPAGLIKWMEEMELLEWLRDAATADEHRQRMVLWLTHFGRWHAHEVADMVGVSVQAAWKWVGEYNRQGPPGLRRQGRGGRRWSFLTAAQESDLLRSLEERAVRGDILTAKQILPLACAAAGREVSLAYVYGLLRRRGWRKLGPRPHHVKGNAEARELFKKNSRT